MRWEKVHRRGRPACNHTMPDSWKVSERVQVHGRWLMPGTEVKIRGERGRMRFVRHVQNASGSEWIDVWSAGQALRSFRPERVSRVHIHKRTRQNQKGA